MTIPTPWMNYSPDVDLEDTDSVSGDTSHDASVGNSGENPRDKANQSNKDVIGSDSPSPAKPSDDGSPLDLGPLVMDPPIESSEQRRVGFAEVANLTPPS